VEVDEVRVHTIVGDLPELRVALAHDFRGWIDIAERDRRLILEIGQRQFGTERRVHPTVIQSEQLLNRLLVEGRTLRWR
jgi:hypothetical protein